MGLAFHAIVYVSGYLFLMFAAVCLCCGLYYLAELVEEYTSTTRRLMYGANVAVLVAHVLFAVFESLPMLALLVGFGAHLCYLWLLQSYPFMRLSSPATLASLAVFVVSNVLWAKHFFSHYHQLTHVLCFLLFNAWLVPFGFFISFSVNDSTLPSRQGGRSL